MPYKDKEKRREYQRNYRKNMTEEQKQKRRDYNREWKQNNPQVYTEEQKQRRKDYSQEYNEQNKDKRKEYYKIHNQNPEVKKKRKINEWKRRGVIDEDYEELYNKWINTNNCEECNTELICGKVGGNKTNTKCLDHDHTTGKFRNIVCHACNVKRH